MDGVPHEIVAWPKGALKRDPGTISAEFAAIVRAQRDIFGDLPYGRYVFILHITPDASGGTAYASRNAAVSARSSSISATQAGPASAGSAAATGGPRSSGRSAAGSQGSEPSRGAVIGLEREAGRSPPDPASPGAVVAARMAGSGAGMAGSRRSATGNRLVGAPGRPPGWAP